MFLLLMTSASDVLASDDVSLGALLQTHFFRRSSSDAVLQTHSSRCFKLQINSFALELVQSESLKNSTLIMDPAHLNKLFSISN